MRDQPWAECWLCTWRRALWLPLHTSQLCTTTPFSLTHPQPDPPKSSGLARFGQIYSDSLLIHFRFTSDSLLKNQITALELLWRHWKRRSSMTLWMCVGSQPPLASSMRHMANCFALLLLLHPTHPNLILKNVGSESTHIHIHTLHSISPWSAIHRRVVG
jgi:hypothetical protein